MNETYYLKQTKEPIRIISKTICGYYCVLVINRSEILYLGPWQINPIPTEEPDPSDLISRLKDPNYLRHKERHGYTQRFLFIGSLMQNSKLTETHKRLLKMYKTKK